MFTSYFTVGWRQLLRNRGYSFINISGLAIGMTVAIFIGLWIFDELSFNKYHANYDSIAQVHSVSVDPETSHIESSVAVQYALGPTLKSNYPQYFKHVVMAWWINDFTLSIDDRKFSRMGEFIEPAALEMLSLKMIKGSYNSLDKPNSIVLSQSAAKAIFGDIDPLNKTLSIDSRMEVEVTGIYEDIPRNNKFSEAQFFIPWSLWVASNDWVKRSEGDWDNRPFNIYVQLQPNVTMATVNAAIQDLFEKNVPEDFYKTIAKYKPYAQVVPMSTWHLYSEMEAGKPSGGRITFVWLFGVIGTFVLILACINFVNLSTARSEKRAREVGVRKAIGSGKAQLVAQFLSESFLVVILSFLFSLCLLGIFQPLFNQLSDKAIELPFDKPLFWVIAFGFIAITGFLAGLYPAFYLSSFQPVKVLKGTLRASRYAALPRKVMVVVQFTVSVVLMIGTVIVYQQIQYAQARPIGYDRNGLISLSMNDPNYSGKTELLRAELLSTGVVSEVATSTSPLTAVWNVTGGYTWEGKDPTRDVEFAVCNVTLDFGKTVGWQFVAGRDFSSSMGTDSTNSVIINETAAKYIGFNDPVGELLTDVDEFGTPKWSKTIIGVVKDMVMESPYDPVRQTIFYYSSNPPKQLNIKVSPTATVSSALPAIHSVLDKVVPTALFDYKFVDEEYLRKFSQEERVGKLSGIFAALAVLISCLGLFGLASFVAEQRTKEIGIRKVMGASVPNLWRLLSRDFVLLVIVACFFAIPFGYYLMSSWLERFDYRTEISLWIFVLTSAGAIVVTLMTVSYQSIKAARMNPVNSLRSE